MNPLTAAAAVRHSYREQFGGLACVSLCCPHALLMMGWMDVVVAVEARRSRQEWVYVGRRHLHIYFGVYFVALSVNFRSALYMERSPNQTT